ncbi:hypothetical protein KXQ82_19445 [Mucilaginibacter sp. HMF5004]|uniref:hypothetical protein n=1 Tax=Mucilaginibacter rivuli TaxID=2857527 RepID=UPI001C5DA74E|nr:hypothetical protein [Mucilaginibacter rivuli]MBW4891908.1 hypothetical protein [Mucilaginibacter rivuli]
MKKVYITALLISSLSISVFATDGGKKDKAKAETKVSSTVLNQFTYEFKDAQAVTWVIDGNCQKALFTYEGTAMTAFYSLSGEYMGVTNPTAFAKIPADAQKEISSKYKEYTIGEVIEFRPAATNSASIYSFSSYSNDEKVYFVDLKNDKEEFLLRVTPNASVFFFKQVK